MRCECCDYAVGVGSQSAFNQSVTWGNAHRKVRPRDPDGAFICDVCYGETIEANKEFDDEYTRSVEEFFSKGS